MITALVLASGTLLLVAVSWRSLPHPRSHGFFRFFAFDAVLCLVVLNAPHWFDHLGASRQLLASLLLTASFCLAIHGFYLLRRFGQPTPPGPGSSLFGIENTAVLVTSGAYRYIRHPLYAAVLLLAWGAALKAVSLLNLGLALVATGALVLTAKTEEAENLVRFGAAYRAYMTRTRLFIPFLL